MTPRHHVADDLLIDYAAGSLAEGWSLAVATHLSLCPECRARLAAAEAAGGQLMEILRLDPEPDAWAAVRARLGAPETVPTPQPKSAVLPKPLRDYVGGDLETVRWKAIGTAGAQFRFKTGDGRTQVRLLKIPAGQPVPEHSHRGRELTVVLAGAFRDGDLLFGRGDIEDADEQTQHIPTATPEADCICLAVTDAPLRFTSWLVRLVQPILRI
jgi:putative transcriptional regulator